MKTESLAGIMLAVGVTKDGISALRICTPDTLHTRVAPNDLRIQHGIVHGRRADASHGNGAASLAWGKCRSAYKITKPTVLSYGRHKIHWMPGVLTSFEGADRRSYDRVAAVRACGNKEETCS